MLAVVLTLFRPPREFFSDTAFSSIKFIYSFRQFLILSVDQLICVWLVLVYLHFCDDVYGLYLNGLIARIQKVKHYCNDFWSSSTDHVLMLDD